MSWSILMLYAFLCPAWVFMIRQSSYIFGLWKMVRRGFAVYGEPWTDEERAILSKTNDIVVRSTEISIVAYFCAGFGTFCKEMTPNSLRLYRTPYPGWFPWAIDSNLKFLAALLYQFTICLNTTFALEGIFLLFAYHTIHIEGQLRLLKKHYEDTFPPGLPSYYTHSVSLRQRTMRRLKECVRHHLVIVAFHKSTLRYFGPCLLIYRIICTIMLCLLCYMATTGIALNKLVQLFFFALALLFLCLTFCIKGQQVTNMSELWRQTIFEVDWWNHPIEVQRTVQMMLIGASKPMLIYGLWKSAMYSHEGIAVIGQEAFSFFNMLRAMQ